MRDAQARGGKASEVERLSGEDQLQKVLLDQVPGEDDDLASGLPVSTTDMCTVDPLPLLVRSCPSTLKIVETIEEISLRLRSALMTSQDRNLQKHVFDLMSLRRDRGSHAAFMRPVS